MLSSQIGVAVVVYNGLLSTFVCCLFFVVVSSVLAGVFYELTDTFFNFLMFELLHCTRD